MLRLSLLLPLLTGSALLAGVAIQKRKSVGPCMPYAEKCLHCTDCTQCKHCSKDGGKCSVCFNR